MRDIRFSAQLLSPCLNLPQARTLGTLEEVFAFYGAMPTGVTVTEHGRIFVCFPQWGDHPSCAVAELRGRQMVPYANLTRSCHFANSQDCNWISVQSVVADWNGGLWVLDTAAPNFSPPIPGGTKLVKIDLATAKIAHIYTFSDSVVLPTSYLNDVRFDFRVGVGGYAYLTDSSIRGPGAIIVLDLATGLSWRRLDGQCSTDPQPGFVPKVEGRVLMNRPPDGSPSPWLVAADGVALSPSGETLYYCPLSSRFLFSISTSALRDPSIPDSELAGLVKTVVEKGASDGLASDERGNIYAGDYESGSIRVISQDGGMRTLAHDPHILWPDTLSIGPDRFLYFTANQLNRQPGFHCGMDLRRKPYSLFRTKIGALPAPTK